MATLNGIEFDELPNSPTFAGGRDGPSAQRLFKVAWPTVEAFVLLFFPAAIRTGRGWRFPISATFPGLPWISAQAFKAEAWDIDKTTGYDSDGVRAYDFAKVTIDYKAPEYDSSDNGQDPAQDGNQILADHSLAFSAEMLKLGVSGWYWETDDEPIKNEEASIVKLVAHIEQTLSWSYVPYPPFNTISRSVGCVNSDEKLFYAPKETLLFTGAEVKRSYQSLTGDESWKVTYKFLQRQVKSGTADDIGWNHFWRNDLGKWDKPQSFTGDPTNPADVINSDLYDYVYPSVDFADLFYADSSSNT